MAASPARKRGTVLCLSVLVTALACACRAPAPNEPVVRRFGADGEWRHCTLAGERRPAAPCSLPELLASANDVPVPEPGELRVELARARSGPVLLFAEAYTFEEPPVDPGTRGAWENLGPLLPTTGGHRGLAHLIGQPPLREAPQAPVTLPSVPATATLHFAPEDRGRRAAYAVWAWPIEPSRIDLGQVRSHRGVRLALGFGIQEAAWDAGGPPVDFVLVAKPRGRGPKRILWQRRLDPARVEADRGWQETEVDLSPQAGAELRLLLAARTAERGRASLPVWARPALIDDTSAGAARPGIILLSLDTLRADHVSAYGYARRTTPALDRLAASGVLFEQAVAPFPSTTASHMTMLTSLLPCAHGVLGPGSLLGQGIPTLAERLAAQGYATAAITEDGLIKGDIGFERGFDTYRDLVGTGSEPLGLFDRGIALARAWLERHGRLPFFLFLHTYQVHIPYKVPDHYKGLFPVEPTASEARRQEADYDAGLRHADDLVAGFVAFLEQSGVLAHTFLVVTSDHGTEFDDHGGIGHAHGVYEEQVRVPLIVVHPTLPRGRRVHPQVGLVDLAPTLLALAGAPAVPTFTGTSLVPLLRDGTVPPRDLFAEQLWWEPRHTLLRTARYAWIDKPGGLELYDLVNDPREQRNLGRERADLAAEGGRRIAEFRTACQRLQLALRSNGPTPTPLDPERVRALRALGYVR